MLLISCQRSCKLRFFNLNPQIDCLRIEVSIDAIHISEMICLDVLLCLHNLIGLSLPHNFSEVFSVVILIKRRKFDPPTEVSWSDFDSTSQVIPVVLCSTHHRQNKMSLSQIFALETLWNFVNDRTQNKVEQNIQHHVAPVTRGRVGCWNSKNNNEHQSKYNEPISCHIIHVYLSPVVFHHCRCKVDGVLKFSESHLFFRERRLFESLTGVWTSINRLDLRIADIDQIWVAVFGLVVNLLRLCAHEAVRCGDFTQVNHRHTRSCQDVLVGILQEVRESHDKLLIIHALHELVGVELVFELPVVCIVRLVYQLTEIVSCKRFLDFEIIHLIVHFFSLFAL